MTDRFSKIALTFDDVLLMPNYSEVLPKAVVLTTQLTRSISLNIPLISAAMDTVTEAPLAIGMAQEGGLGILHKSLSIEQQAQEVRRVKKFESGVVRDPITVGPNATVDELKAITQAHNISGVPVVGEGGFLVLKNLEKTKLRIFLPFSIISFLFFTTWLVFNLFFIFGHTIQCLPVYRIFLSGCSIL